jgi:hypothetical protein
MTKATWLPASPRTSSAQNAENDKPTRCEPHLIMATVLLNFCRSLTATFDYNFTTRLTISFEMIEALYYHSIPYFHGIIST